MITCIKNLKFVLKVSIYAKWLRFSIFPMSVGLIYFNGISCGRKRLFEKLINDTKMHMVVRLYFFTIIANSNLRWIKSSY